MKTFDSISISTWVIVGVAIAVAFLVAVYEFVNRKK